MSTPLPEYLPFPLYHGTSTLWEQSIRMHGLGGRRILSELRALEFFRRARECLKVVPTDWPVGTELCMVSIEAQSVTTGGFNFRHGGVYLSPSRQTAVRYAVQNQFGSELLTFCQLLRKAHTNARENAGPRWFEEYTELIEVLEKLGEPIIVRVDRMRSADLMNETGDVELKNLGRLLDWIAESEAGTLHRKARDVELRDALENGNGPKIAELMALREGPFLSVEQIIETFGQTSNFEANVVIPAVDLIFEQIRNGSSST